MYLSICTGVYGECSYPEMLDKVKAHGLNYVEICVGGCGYSLVEKICGAL